MFIALMFKNLLIAIFKAHYQSNGSKFVLKLNESKKIINFSFLTNYMPISFSLLGLLIRLILRLYVRRMFSYDYTRKEVIIG